MTNRWLWYCLLSVCLVFLCPTVRAENAFRATITGVGENKFPVAVAKFLGEEGAVTSVTAIVKANLERSGMFRLVNATLPNLDETSTPSITELRQLQADVLLTGSVKSLANGKIEVRFRLWDARKGSQLGGQILSAHVSDMRLLAHRVADTVYEKMTGEQGAFATRIAYVSRSRNAYALMIADADGEGAQTALSSTSSIISPVWSPDGRRLAYVTFESRKAVVVVQDVQTGKRSVLANFRGSNSSPAWSPDSNQLLVTLSHGGGSQLYLLGLDGKIIRRLAASDAIDTEATWSPDGQHIYFISDRSGGPQIYRTTLQGDNIQRITFNGNYNISPDISPDGKWMVYVSQSDGAYQTHVMELSTGKIRSVSDTRHDESPSFAPNSRWLVYATKMGGKNVLMTTTVNGNFKTMTETGKSTVLEPNWGPFLPFSKPTTAAPTS